jgi:hypothetical protein
MENIHIFENFLNELEQCHIIDVLNDYSYDYGIKSKLFEENFEILEYFFSNDVNNSLFDNIVRKIETEVSKKLKIIRYYVTNQTFGKNGSYHYDNMSKNTYTFCLYFTTISNKDLETIGGNFYIKIPNEKFILSVETNNNRGIFFPSQYIHNGMSYNRYTRDIKRLCCVWHLEEVVKLLKI